MLLTKRSYSHDVATGDVVRLKDRADLMTVEAVHQETFGPVLDCIWFDSEDGLRYRRFPVSQTDIFPRPAPMNGGLSVGLEVRLRSRGPVMTVRALTTRDGVPFAQCVWTGALNRERRRLFPVETLVLSILERFEGEGA
ncbi:MAG: DUF2158 domain-containing protein [Litorimonas sp.]